MLLPGSLLLSRSSGLAVARGLLLAAAPQGGQQRARRNAWSGMVADAQRARSRREAGAALDAARGRRGVDAQAPGG